MILKTVPSTREIEMSLGDRTIDQADENVRAAACQFHQVWQFDQLQRVHNHSSQKLRSCPMAVEWVR